MSSALTQLLYMGSNSILSEADIKQLKTDDRSDLIDWVSDHS